MSKRIGFLRVLNEENTMPACLLSVAPALDHLAILWSDTTDRSIDMAREWEGEIARLGCSLSFVRYPHPVVPPHSVPDLRVVPAENRIDTYLNYGMDHIRGLYPGEEIVVAKVDADQIYVTPEFDAFCGLVRGPSSCHSLFGHNTLVHEGRLMLFKPQPLNGTQDDHLACGMGNLPRYGIAAPFEIDRARHGRIVKYARPAWMHFRREFRGARNIRPFKSEETIPLSERPKLVATYEAWVLPLLQKTGSPYAALRLD